MQVSPSPSECPLLQSAHDDVIDDWDEQDDNDEDDGDDGDDDDGEGSSGARSVDLAPFYRVLNNT